MHDVSHTGTASPLPREPPAPRPPPPGAPVTSPLPAGLHADAPGGTGGPPDLPGGTGGPPGGQGTPGAPREPAGPLRVLLVGGGPLGATGLADALRHEPQLSVLVVGSERADVPVVCRDQQVEVAVLVDVAEPGRERESLLTGIATVSPATSVCVLSAASHDIWLTYLGQGATGLLDEHAGPEVVTAAVRAIHAGTWVFSAEVARFLVRIAAGSPRGQHHLTRREAEVLRLVAAGAPNRRIAEMLDVSEKTVRNYVSRVYHKLAIEDRSQLVRQATATPDALLTAPTATTVR